MSTRFSVLIFLLLLVVFFSLSTAQIHISGPLSGTLVDTTYIVDGNISVADSAGLIIEAGADFLFQGQYEFVINGYLIATGTEDDSITFRPLLPDSYWLGIEFNYANGEFCLMEYCFITGSNDQGITIYGCNPTIRHCSVVGNSGIGWGGGISCRLYASPVIDHCFISDNSNSLGGGITVAFDSNPIISHCIITENTSSEGAGIHVEMNCNPTIDHCIIFGNSANHYGGGIAVLLHSTPEIINCTIIGNATSEDDGGGIHARADAHPLVVNTIVAYNSGGGGIDIDFDSDASITNSNIYQNAGMNFVGLHDPDSIGILVDINANGDSCDIYQNIFMNPMFVDTANGDYHLMAGSPCIDAGDPLSPLDPDSTVADIGAYYYDQSSWVYPEDRLAVPKEFRLLQNYPNPFNNTTVIGYQLPAGDYVRLEIYNLLGQRITTLFNSYQHPGYQSVIWDASGAASGIYYCRLSAGDNIWLRKMILLK